VNLYSALCENTSNALNVMHIYTCHILLIPKLVWNHGYDSRPT